MKLRATTILCLLLSVQIAFAQRLFFATGIGTYEMGDLKATQDFVGASTPIPLTNISSFPAYWNYEGGIAFDLYDYLSGGVAIGYGSTGARSAYSDYSGSMRFDQLARYASIALLPSYGQYYLNDQVRINYELRFGMTFNRMAFSFEQTIAADSESESIQGSAPDGDGSRSALMLISDTISLFSRAKYMTKMIQIWSWLIQTLVRMRA
jgi:hypothetical protein